MAFMKLEKRPQRAGDGATGRQEPSSVLTLGFMLAIQHRQPPRDAASKLCEEARIATLCVMG
jgi:hypothetical protein